MGGRVTISYVLECESATSQGTDDKTLLPMFLYPEYNAVPRMKPLNPGSMCQPGMNMILCPSKKCVRKNQSE